jgi:signal transduction histidine kinase
LTISGEQIDVPLSFKGPAGQKATVAVASMNRSLRRFMSLAVPLTFLEVLFNAAQQWQHLNQLFTVVAFGLLFLGQLGMFFSSWFGSADGGWFGYYALINILIVALWSLPPFAPENFPSGAQPWLWWSTGMAVLCAVLFVGPVYSFIYMVALSTGFTLIRIQPSGGAVDIVRALEDAAYIVLLGAILGGLYYMVLFASRRADLANTLAVRQLTRRTSVDAFERERQLVDALVHDRVLNALLVAASADNPAQRQRAATLAEQAIEDLRRAASDRGIPQTITAQALFRALRKAATRIDTKIEASVLSSSRLPLSQDVAAALTEATLQAIDNSLRHSGASNLQIRMEATSAELTIEIADNGRGFRVNRVPRNRLGISNSILARMRNVNGHAEIFSEPGSGSRVVLRWAA